MMRCLFTQATILLLFYRAVAKAAVTLPAAVDIPSSQQWDGNDGPWSSFPVSVGTPEQQVRVFPSTAATSSWVVGMQGCNSSWVTFDIPNNCTAVRGGTFNNYTSSTWSHKNFYHLEVEDYLGFGELVGDFGFDTVELGYTGSSTILSNTTVAFIEAENFTVGMFGLNARPTNFSTDSNDIAPSYLSTLYTQGKIPSLTYSYTAGAKYMFDNGVPGSLTLGGYDKGLFVENDVQFNFYYDQTFDLTVGVQAITASNTQQQDLLPVPKDFFIDSTTAQIWLPDGSYQAFEAVFGLEYNATTDLYLVNDTQHASLLAQNSSVTFTLVPLLNSPTLGHVNITLPYAAFDKEVSWGYYGISDTTGYFPIRRSVNNSHFVLGRTFMQEAYLTVDYNNSIFNVSQRSWEWPQKSQIVSLPLPLITPPHSKSAPSPKIIAAIAIGALAIISPSVFTICFLLRRKRLRGEKRKEEEEAAALKAAEKEEIVTPDPFATPSGVINEIYTEKWETPELHGRHFFNGAEVDGSHASEKRYELGRGMEGIEGRQELEAPHGTVELPPSGCASSSGSSRKSEDVTEAELASPSEPVSPQSVTDGSERGFRGCETPVSPQSPVPMRNDRHLVYGYF